MPPEDMVEILDVVDSEDRFLGTEERKEIHRKKLVHRAVHIFVQDEKGRLYLQKRAMTKDQNPGRWDSSASGHVHSGESYSDAAVRELQEELGIRSPLRPLKKFAACEATDGEHSMLYATVLERGFPGPEPNPEEILEGRFFTLDEIKKQMLRNPTDYTSSFRLVFEWFLQNPG